MSSQYDKRRAKAKGPKITETVIEHPMSDSNDPEPTLDRVAYDVVFDDTLRQYVKVAIAYDLSTGTAKVRDVSNLSDNQPVSIKKMTELYTRKILKLPIEGE
jgi:hypothetical protein